MSSLTRDALSKERLPDALSPARHPDLSPVAWRVAEGLVPYPEAVEEMEQLVAAIRDGTAAEQVWLVEHPPLYTAGTSAKDADLIAPTRFPVFRTGRGGQYTYHGPGQRVAYTMLDVRQRGGDVRRFVTDLEAWIIATLACFNIQGERREDRVGVWVRRPDRGPGAEDKIAAIGIRVRKGVAFHGISINVEPELEHFSGIVPCGVRDHGVTSLINLGQLVSMAEVDMALRASFEDVFGRKTALTS
ncbi:MAG: lipoyl(octanoyl) transferase LipB [Pseudomonadota bacterium]